MHIFSYSTGLQDAAKVKRRSYNGRNILLVPALHLTKLSLAYMLSFQFQVSNCFFQQALVLFGLIHGGGNVMVRVFV